MLLKFQRYDKTNITSAEDNQVLQVICGWYGRIDYYIAYELLRHTLLINNKNGTKR